MNQSNIRADIDTPSHTQQIINYTNDGCLRVLSPKENFCTIARMENTHYWFYKTSKVYICYSSNHNESYTEKRQLYFDRTVSGQTSPQ